MCFQILANKLRTPISLAVGIKQCKSILQKTITANTIRRRRRKCNIVETSTKILYHSRKHQI